MTFLQDFNTKKFRQLLRKTGNTTNVGIFVTGFCGYMLVDRIWSWQAALAAALFAMILGPLVAFSISCVMKRLRPQIEEVLDAPDLESVDPSTLQLGRRYLLEIPATNFIVSAVVWLVVLPFPIYSLLAWTGLSTVSFSQTYFSLALVFPILGYASAVQFEYALRPIVKQFFPNGGVEQFRSKNILSLRWRILPSVALLGPYSTIVIAALLLRRIHESQDIESAMARIIPVELFFVALSITMFFFFALYFERSINRPLKKLLESSRVEPDVGGVAVPESLSIDSADDWGIVADRLNERKRAQAELAASEARIRLMIESMPVGLLLLSEAGIIELSNSALQSDTGYSETDMLGQHFSILLKSAGDQSVSAFWSQAKGEKSPVLKLECERKSGDKYPVELTIESFESNEGLRYLAIVTNITEREEMEKIKRQFVAVVSHELRSPLTSMLAYLTLLSEGVYGELNPQGLKRTDATRRNINRLMDLVKDILDIERLESGQISYLMKDVSLADVVKRSVEGLEEFAERQQVTLKAISTDVIVNADEDRLIQVVVNLLSNAIKFSRGGTVEVSVAVEGEFAKIGVRDSGRGIPAESQKLIFERFKQVSGADQHTGTGLGLPICKSIVEHHGGTIGVESVEGSGSFFWFTLPLKS